LFILLYLFSGTIMHFHTLVLSVVLCLSSKAFADDADDVLQIVNQQRSANGLSPVRLSDVLNRISVEHSQDMRRMNSMTHSGSDGSSPGDRARRAGYQFSKFSENVAEGFNSAQSVVEGWLNSAGHRRNILDSAVTEMGVGRSGNFWTQNFGNPIGGPTPSSRSFSNTPQLSSGDALADLLQVIQQQQQPEQQQQLQQPQQQPTPFQLPQNTLNTGNTGNTSPPNKPCPKS
jgi:hypothetical protein